MARRSPQQTLTVTVVVIGGILLGLSFMQREKTADEAELATQLPDLELVDLSPEALYQRSDFKPHPGMPKSWDHIHLRLYAEPDGIYLKYLRCTIDADEVEPTNPAAFKQGMYRRREADEMPPGWWPGGADETDPKWRTPDWWTPAAGTGTGTWWAVPDRDTVIGMYLHYDPETRLMHMREWRRQQAKVDPPSDLVDRPVVDQVASALARELALEGHPVVFGDWLESVQLGGSRVAGLAASLPEGLESADAMLRPKREMRYLLALRGLDRAAAESLLSDLPMRPDPADTKAPAADWAFALPQSQQGEAQLPSWFTPGAGPRWRYELRRPGSGTLEEARWAAYDEAARTLYVWDWRGRESGS